MLPLTRLLEILFPSRDAEARVQDSSFDSLASFIEPAVIEMSGASITTLLPYRTIETKACIREAKFHYNTRAHRLLGEVLAEFLKEFLREREAFQKGSVVLVPIPLSRKRRLTRGHNQVESVARAALRTLRASDVSAIKLDTKTLTRIRDTEPQTSLTKEARNQNMRGAFRAVRTPDPVTTYIVLDDVATTGATLSAGAKALTEAGPCEIVLLALAH